MLFTFVQKKTTNHFSPLPKQTAGEQVALCGDVGCGNVLTRKQKYVEKNYISGSAASDLILFFKLFI